MKTFIPQRRILICTTVQITVKTFLNPHIRLLQEMGFQVDVAAQADGSAPDIVADCIYDLPFQRTPFSWRNLIAGLKLQKLVKRNRYCAVHFHTPVASAWGRWSIRRFRRSGMKVFYTAHGFHFFRGASVINWLSYYPAEYFLSRYTDCLITINAEDSVAAEHFLAGEHVYVPGVGIDCKKLAEISLPAPKAYSALQIPKGTKLLLSVGELNRNKNHSTILHALALLREYSWIYLICGRGNQETVLRETAQILGIADRVRFLGFRKDVQSWFAAATIFIFPSFREGLSVALMEAMAAGLPVVASDIRGNRDLIVHGKGGLLVEPHDVAGFAWAISELLNRDDCSMGEFNRAALAAFELPEVLESMRRIYRKHLKSYV